MGRKENVRKMNRRKCSETEGKKRKCNMQQEILERREDKRNNKEEGERTKCR
jgi:hypothetical protein